MYPSTVYFVLLDGEPNESGSTSKEERRSNVTEFSAIAGNGVQLLRKRRWGCSSAGRAPALQAGGQRFDPAHLHQGP